MKSRALVLATLALAACGEQEPTAERGAQVRAERAAQLQAERADTLTRGQSLYGRHCAACHDAGDGHPGTMRLAARLGAARAVLRERRDLPPDYVAQIVRRGLQMMPPFRPSEISDAEISALAAWVAQHYEAGS